MKIKKETPVRPVGKLERAYTQLSQMAYNLGPDARMPTFASLCEQTRVSKATLDTALGQLEAQGIILRRQGAGIYVSPQLKRSIALICDPQFSIEPRLRGFWELIVREARLRVAGSHYDLAFHFSATPGSAPDAPPLHPGLMDDIRTGLVQGVLTVGLPIAAVQWISDQGVAVVAFAGEGPVSVNLDGVDVVESGVEILVAHGCRRLALWSEIEQGADSDTGEDSRVPAFLRALADNGLAFESDWLRPQAHEATGRSDFDLVLDWVKEIFGKPREDWPDGLLVTNDILTRDVMSALRKFNVVPNRDVVIASHANTDSPVLHAYEGDISLIEYDSGEIVQVMFDQLEALLRGDSVAHRRITVRPKARAQAFD